MGAPVEPSPLWLEALKGVSFPLSAVVTGLFGLATAYLGFRLGFAKSDHELEIEKERLKAQGERESEKALREARGKKLKEWRGSITFNTAMHSETRKTNFN